MRVGLLQWEPVQRWYNASGQRLPDGGMRFRGPVPLTANNERYQEPNLCFCSDLERRACKLLGCILSK